MLLKFFSSFIPTVHVTCGDDESADVVNRHALTIKTLTSSKDVKVNEKPPQGCAVSIVNDKVSIGLMLLVRFLFIIITFESESHCRGCRWDSVLS